METSLFDWTPLWLWPPPLTDLPQSKAQVRRRCALSSSQWVDVEALAQTPSTAAIHLTAVSIGLHCKWSLGKHAALLNRIDFIILQEMHLPLATGHYKHQIPRLHQAFCHWARTQIAPNKAGSVLCSSSNLLVYECLCECFFFFSFFVLCLNKHVQPGKKMLQNPAWFTRGRLTGRQKDHNLLPFFAPSWNSILARKAECKKQITRCRNPSEQSRREQSPLHKLLHSDFPSMDPPVSRFNSVLSNCGPLPWIHIYFFG